MKFTDEEYARQQAANRIHELEQRVEELEGTTTLTETKPTETGWHWFIPNGMSPPSVTSSVAVVVLVGEWPLYKSNIKGGNLCVRFPVKTMLVSVMGGLWSEKLNETDLQG